MREKIVTALIVLVFFFGTTSFYQYYEHWSGLDSTLYVVSTVTTVGFGYNSPSDDFSRVFTIFVILFGVTYVLKALLNLMYHILRYVEQRTAATLERLFIFSLSLVLIVLIGGAFAFSYIQSNSFITGLYFAVETSTTLGTGDIPVNNNIKLFLIFYLVISTLVCAFAFENFTSMRARVHLHKKKQKILLNKADFVAIVDEARSIMRDSEFKHMNEESKESSKYISHPRYDTGGVMGSSGGMEEEERESVRIGQYQFVVCVLAHLGSIDVSSEVVPWLKKFQELDVQNSGYLTTQQLSNICADDTSFVEAGLVEDEEGKRCNNDSNSLNIARNI